MNIDEIKIQNQSRDSIHGRHQAVAVISNLPSTASARSKPGSQSYGTQPALRAPAQVASPDIHHTSKQIESRHQQGNPNAYHYSPLSASSEQPQKLKHEAGLHGVGCVQGTHADATAGDKYAGFQGRHYYVDQPSSGGPSAQLYSKAPSPTPHQQYLGKHLQHHPPHHHTGSGLSRTLPTSKTGSYPVIVQSGSGRQSNDHSPQFAKQHVETSSTAVVLQRHKALEQSQYGFSCSSNPLFVQHEEE